LTHFEPTVVIFAPYPVLPKMGYNGKHPHYNLRAIHHDGPVEEPHYAIGIKEGTAEGSQPWIPRIAFGF
jgi:hypothetical protein